ncbi:hypothetical protein P8C59_009007 [Phyllachora maydis]|uniref:Uncharacterized protein n=1 Tax=Phyllachora maydis TaxID=1825666 RepID=A0AAD9IC89_9PEZI|nr:hypothetical protein P8C59_009007 [Phyllachora maydis]
MSDPAGTASASASGPISNLPPLHRYITGHDPASGTAIVVSSTPLAWQPHDDNQLAFSVAYATTALPADLNDDADLRAHAAVAARVDAGTMGLVQPGGTVLRAVDFAPGYACGMHRTQSLDYGIVLEGEVDMVLDSGATAYRLRRGDVAVQRATQHQWVNRSRTEWARMMFVLQHVPPLVVGGREMKEDLGTVEGSVPPSGN